jgi:hypothetical protein
LSKLTEQIVEASVQQQLANMALDPAAKAMYACFKVFCTARSAWSDEALAAADFRATEVDELVSDESIRMKAVNIAMSVLIAGQALYRPLNPDETRETLVTRCKLALDKSRLTQHLPSGIGLAVSKNCKASWICSLETECAGICVRFRLVASLRKSVLGFSTRCALETR